MRFKLSYENMNTHGANSMHPERKDKVVRIVLRGEEDKYNEIASIAHELINVPYLFGSHTPTGKDKDHQAHWQY